MHSSVECIGSIYLDHQVHYCAVFQSYVHSKKRSVTRSYSIHTQWNVGTCDIVSSCNVMCVCHQSIEGNNRKDHHQALHDGRTLVHVRHILHRRSSSVSFQISLSSLSVSRSGPHTKHTRRDKDIEAKRRVSHRLFLRFYSFIFSALSRNTTYLFLNFPRPLHSLAVLLVQHHPQRVHTCPLLAFLCNRTHIVSRLFFSSSSFRHD